MKIKLEERVGRAAIGYDEGHALLEEIRQVISGGSEVELDFEGVEMFASPFFNASLAILAQEFNADNLNRQLKLENLSRVGRDIARRSIENAKEFRNPAQRQRLAEALTEGPE